jgi:hypothetical protein
MSTLIADALGEVWCFDGERVFLLSAEEELGEQNGYPCKTEEEAIAILIDGGYIEIAT